jgi:hypothetical protein
LFCLKIREFWFVLENFEEMRRFEETKWGILFCLEILRSSGFLENFRGLGILACLKFWGIEDLDFLGREQRMNFRELKN